MSKNSRKKKNNSKENNLNKEKDKINSLEENSSNSIWNAFIVVCIIIIIICLFYILTVHITDSNTNSTTDKTSGADLSISYTNIMVGRSLSMSDGEYLVAYYDKNDEDVKSDFEELINTYNSKSEHLKLYVVDMSDGLNKNYTGDEANTNPQSASDIVINGPTLILVDEHKIEEYIQGIDSITAYLQ